MSVKAWGSTEHGALGVDVKNDEHLVPKDITGLLASRRIDKVGTGHSHSMAIDDTGTLYTWGRNREGQLGHGHRSIEPVLIPTRVEALRHERIAQVVGGPSHTLCVTRSGVLYAFGSHSQKADRSNSTVFFYGARQMPEHKRRMIEQSHSSFLNASRYVDTTLATDATESSELQGEDEDDSGAGGPTRPSGGERGQVGGTGTVFQRVIKAIPWKVPVPSGHLVKTVSAGHCISALVTVSGQAYTWGENDKGQLGLGDRHARESPCLVPKLPSVSTVSCGEQHCVAIAENGEGWSFGLGVFGQLGLGDNRDRLLPDRIESYETLDPSDNRMKEVACGLYHTVFLTEGGAVLLCGHKEYGQQGDATDFGETENGMGRTQCQLVPKQLDLTMAFGSQTRDMTSVKVSSIASGALHSIAVLHDGRVISWGWGVSGALGLGWGEEMGRKFAATPARLVEALEGNKALQASAGRRHTLALVEATPTSALVPDMEKLLCDLSERWADICFVVAKRRIMAIYSIITARCPRMAAIIAFSSSRFSKAEQAGFPVIQIDSISPVAFQSFLRYLYTDQLDVVPSRLHEVSTFARRMRMPKLEELCARLRRIAIKAGIPMQGVVNPSKRDLQESRGVWSTLKPGGNQLGIDLLGLRDGSSPSNPDLELRPHDCPDFASLWVHRFMLAARCQFFATAFDSDFLEGSGPDSSVFYFGLDDTLEDTLVELDSYDGSKCDDSRECQWASMAVVLDYIYSGTCTLSLRSGFVLSIFTLRLADEFLLSDLMESVEALLEERLISEKDEDSKRSLASLLAPYAEQHRCVRLLAACQLEQGVLSGIEQCPERVHLVA